MRRTVAETVVSFLLGAAWAIVLLGAVLLFWSFSPFGLVIALMAGIIGSFFGLFLVVVLEAISAQFEKVRLLKRQVALLEKMAGQRDAGKPESDETASLRRH
ncbi:MAG: hypothetical protein GXO33_01250 [Epsilonproteobacteria bacterium]|nr:hypothetical protein [Campylobacterota bacterium]